MTRTRPPEKQLDMEHFKIVERDGHHEPNGQRGHHARCGCAVETSGGYAYRDKVAESTNTKKTTWDRIRFYHQSPIVKKNGNIIRVNTYGYGGKPTTRERINKELPTGFRITQTDHEVKLELPNGDEVDIPRQFDIQPADNSIRKPSGDLLFFYHEEEFTGKVYKSLT